MSPDPRATAVCPACESHALRVFYEVPKVPIHSCLMVATREEAIDFPSGELRVAVCESCGFLTNLAFQPQRMKYSTAYEETQGFSPRFQQFQTELVEGLMGRHDLAGKTALEIGCGKGEFLIELCERAACRGLGLDPSYRPERVGSALPAGLDFIQDFYSEKYTDLPADLVCCRHTLEHIPDVDRFTTMVRRSIGDRPATQVFFELPDGERILRQGAFWDVYYEHCSYFTRGSLARLFRRNSFTVALLELAYDQQYILIETEPVSAPVSQAHPAEESVEQVLSWVEEYTRQVEALRHEWRGRFQEFARANKRTAVWGSGSKAVSFLTTLGIREEVHAVVDINPHKHGKFLAGTGHRIIAPEELRQQPPDEVIVMNSIYLEEIRESLSALGLSPTLRGL